MLELRSELIESEGEENNRQSAKQTFWDADKLIEDLFN